MLMCDVYMLKNCMLKVTVFRKLGGDDLEISVGLYIYISSNTEPLMYARMHVVRSL